MQKPLKYLNSLKNFIVSAIYFDKIDEIVFAARRIASNSETPEKKGGYLALCNAANGDLICTMVGIVEDEAKKRKYQRCATEKATRLFTMPGHVRSSATADESKEWYGGGIKHKDLDFIVAFPGFSENVDEAISIAYCSFCIALEEIGEANSNSANKHLVNLLMLDIMEKSNKRFYDNPAINELIEVLRDK